MGHRAFLRVRRAGAHHFTFTLSCDEIAGSRATNANAAAARCEAAALCSTRPGGVRIWPRTALAGSAPGFLQRERQDLELDGWHGPGDQAARRVAQGGPRRARQGEALCPQHGGLLQQRAGCEGPHRRRRRCPESGRQPPQTAAVREQPSPHAPRSVPLCTL
eukprot:3581740-Prymnesium_polylepis.1